MDNFEKWITEELAGYKQPLTIGNIKMIAHNAYVQGRRYELENNVTTIGKFILLDHKLVSKIISAILADESPTLDT